MTRFLFIQITGFFHKFEVLKIPFLLTKHTSICPKGREMKTLVNEFKSTGYYTVDFNGSNLSSGVYFYKIEAGSFSQTKRLVLLK